jgi:hypothetical protein
MADTPKLGLPEITASQSNKHVTHNEGLGKLDVLVQSTVKDRVTTPPGSPSHGDCYLVIATATGGFAGHEDDIAQYYNGDWAFYTPNEGWRIWVDDEDQWYQHDGSAWVKNARQTVFIPAADFLDGSSAPDAIETITSGNGKVRIRKFAGDSSQDVIIPWEVPANLAPSYKVKFWVVGIITEATAPSSEGISFKLAGYSIGDDDPLDGTFGTEIESKKTGMSHAQNDRFKTDKSNDVTITDLDAGEMAMLKLYRDHDDADDTYVQKIGVSGVVIEYVETCV